VTPIPLPKNFRAIVPIVAGVGNGLMAMPLVRQLKTRAGAGHITVFARIDAMAELFRRLDEVDEVVVTGTGARNQWRWVRQMRARRADVFVVPFPSNRWQYGMLVLTCGARQAVLHDYPVGRLRAMHFVGTRMPAVHGVHDVEQNLRMLRLLGAEPDMSEAPRFHLRQDDRSRARELLNAIGIGEDQPFIAMHAGSGRTVLAESKRWPTERYAELVEMIGRELSIDVVLLEGPDETGVAEEITSYLRDGAIKPRVLKLAGNLGVAGAVLERAALYAGSDSGLAHLAAAVGTRPVTIFAPADPDRVCPFGYRELVVKSSQSCSPCFLYPWQATRPKVRCGSNGQPMCITAVTVEQVMTTVRGAMQTNSLSLRERVG
jgi:ADP-heptose:LPS heptosyltransferase